MERKVSKQQQLPEEAIGFPPLMCENPKILILGTIPGKSSISAGEYFHDNNNRLWRVLAKISGEDVPADYCSKKSMLARHGIVLWDYYKKVTRVDSSDKGILSGVPNNIPQFLLDNPTIHTIAVLGFGKWKLFGESLKCYCESTEALCGIRVLKLPETSGLNSRWNLLHLCIAWKCIFGKSMFENETNTILSHIEYFNEILSEDWNDGKNFNEEELLNRLQESKDAIKTLKSSLPYDEINGDVPIEDFSGDNLEDGELEDEVVQIEGLITELSGLIQKVEDHYLEGKDEQKHEEAVNPPKNELTKDHFMKLLIEWLKGEISEKALRINIVLDDQAIERMAIAIIISAKCRGNFDDSEKLANIEYPEYQLDKETIRQFHLFSPGIFHITFDVIRHYKLLHKNMDFYQTLNYFKNFWKDLI